MPVSCSSRMSIRAGRRTNQQSTPERVLKTLVMRVGLDLRERFGMGLGVVGVAIGLRAAYLYLHPTRASGWVTICKTTTCVSVPVSGEPRYPWTYKGTVRTPTVVSGRGHRWTPLQNRTFVIMLLCKALPAGNLVLNRCFFFRDADRWQPCQPC